MVLLESHGLEYGKALPGFVLPDVVSKRNISNKDLQHDIAVIAFICNHCPYVVRIIDEFSKLAAKTQDHVSWVAISANDPDYRKQDSPDNMVKFAQDHRFSFPYLFDESQEIARRFGAVCTPDIFVYKRSLRRASGAPQEDGYSLVYHDRFEDLEKAINDLKTADKVSFETKPSAGCSIKWKN